MMTDTTDIQLPLVNLNGTTREVLQRQYHAAYKAIEAAIYAANEAAPHGRDYQTVPGAYQVARAEHIARINRLSDIRDEYLAIVESLIRSDP